MSVSKPSVLSAKCLETTQLLSLELDETLTKRQWWAMNLHTVACAPCRRFRRHLHLIVELLEKSAPEGSLQEQELMAELSPEARARLCEVLRQARLREDEQ